MVVHDGDREGCMKPSMKDVDEGRKCLGISGS